MRVHDLEDPRDLARVPLARDVHAAEAEAARLLAVKYATSGIAVLDVHVERLHSKHLATIRRSRRRAPQLPALLQVDPDLVRARRLVRLRFF